MAVQHGYGKMAGTDALVFAYDTGDAVNSYKGEPAENILALGGSDTEIERSGTSYPYYSINIDSYIQSRWSSSNNVLTLSYEGKRDYVAGGTGGGNDGYPVYYIYFTDWSWAATLGTGAYDWQYVKRTFTMPDPTTKSVRFAIYHMNSGNRGRSYSRKHMLTFGDHAVPFVNGTRSATEGLLDLTGNYTLDISNASFDSNAFITFDGSSDYIDILNSTALFSGTQDLTVEAAYSLEGQGGGEIFGNYGSGHTTNHLWFSGMYGLWINGGVYVPGFPLANGRYHMVGTRKNGLVELYLNGELVNSGTKNGSIATDINYRIGADVNGAAEPFTGDIYVVKAYNRALTGAEVKSNFNNYKTRFNIA